MSVRLKIALLFSIAGSVLLSVHAASAQQVEITTSAAGVEATNVVGSTTENFNEFSTGDYSSLALKGIGTLTTNPAGSNKSLNIHVDDQYGGAAGSGNYAAVGEEAGGSAATSATLTFTQPQAYVGMWWSACDPGNELQLYSGSTLLTTLNETSLYNLVGGSKAYYGNPSQSGADGGEIFAYLNFYALYGDNITSAVITQNNSGAGFEFDNISIATNYSNPGITGSQIVVPEPQEFVVLAFGALGLLGLSMLKYGRTRLTSLAGWSGCSASS